MHITYFIIKCNYFKISINLINIIILCLCQDIFLSLIEQFFKHIFSCLVEGPLSRSALACYCKLVIQINDRNSPENKPHVGPTAINNALIRGGAWAFHDTPDVCSDLVELTNFKTAENVKKSHKVCILVVSRSYFKCFVERRSRNPKMRVKIPLETTNFSLFSAVSD